MSWLQDVPWQAAVFYATLGGVVMYAFLVCGWQFIQLWQNRPRARGERRVRALRDPECDNPYHTGMHKAQNDCYKCKPSRILGHVSDEWQPGRWPVRPRRSAVRDEA